jgi:signal transduction histidine kinase
VPSAESKVPEIKERLARLERQLEAARRISHILFQHTSMDQMIEEAIRTALEVVGAECGSVMLADPESKQFVFRHSVGEKPVARGTTIPWGQGIAGTVFQSGQPEVIPDVKCDGRHFPGIDVLTGYKSRDMIVLPLKRWDREPIGVLTVLNKHDGRLDEDDVAILTIISAFTAMAIEQARLFEEAKLAEVVRLLGDISHDVKNMLMPVVAGAGLLEAELKELFGRLPGVGADKAQTSREMCADVIEMMRKSTWRIQDRVREIGDCVKGLSAPPQFGPCQVAGVVNAVLKTLRWLAQEKGIALRTEGLDDLPPIMADERRLYNAFYNLINNAIPEVPNGGSITIRGQKAPLEKEILLSVSDTGRGMPPEVRDSLFTARAISRKPGGTGLGTKIVKDVVDSHGGQIRVESTEGAGTTFTIRLPIHPPGSPKART